MATKARKKPKRRDRPKQRYLKGMEPRSIPEIDRAADAYRDVRDERMGLTERETELSTALCEAMNKHKLVHYTYDEYVVDLGNTEKVKVKKRPAEVNGEVE